MLLELVVWAEWECGPCLSRRQRALGTTRVGRGLQRQHSISRLCGVAAGTRVLEWMWVICDRKVYEVKRRGSTSAGRLCMCRLKDLHLKKHLSPITNVSTASAANSQQCGQLRISKACTAAKLQHPTILIRLPTSAPHSRHHVHQYFAHATTHPHSSH